MGNGRADSTAAIANAICVLRLEAAPCTSPPGTTWSAVWHRLGDRNPRRPRTHDRRRRAGLVTITNTNASGGLLSIRADHTVVENLTLDAQSANSRQALGVVANYVTVQYCRILGGSQFFAIYYAGPATPSAPAYNSGNLLGNSVNDLTTTTASRGRSSSTA